MKQVTQSYEIRIKFLNDKRGKFLIQSNKFVCHYFRKIFKVT